jgi:hypothetical protein
MEGSPTVYHQGIHLTPCKVGEVKVDRGGELISHHATPRPGALSFIVHHHTEFIIGAILPSAMHGHGQMASELRGPSKMNSEVSRRSQKNSKYR